MLLVDGPARGTLVSFAASGGHRRPWIVDPGEQHVYMPRPLYVMGHVIWVGVCGELVPAQEELFDLLVSVRAKQCQDETPVSRPDDAEH
jgi:hypothetical protein